MIAPTSLFLLSGLLVQSYAAPTVISANETDVHLQLDMSELLDGAVAVDGGYIGNLIEIPGLANITLVDKDGDLVYDIPEDGLDISDELYEALAGEKPKAIDKRDCPNPCACGTHRSYSLANSNWNKFFGNLKAMSSPLCGPGTIAKTYTASYSWQISGSIDPSFKATAGFLERLGVKVGFAYTWGNAVATGYTATCSELHPCIATFKPWVGVVKGRGQWHELSNAGNKLCSSGYGGNIEVHLPIVRDGCSGDKECGADGVWDKCYFVGNYAKSACSNLGPTPASGSLCPAALYPH